LTAEERDGIKYDVAEEVGACIQTEMDGVVFVDVVLKKRNCMKTLQLRPQSRRRKPPWNVLSHKPPHNF